MTLEAKKMSSCLDQDLSGAAKEYVQLRGRSVTTLKPEKSWRSRMGFKQSWTGFAG